MSTNEEQLLLPDMHRPTTKPLPAFEPPDVYIVGFKRCGCPVSFLRNTAVTDKGMITECIKDKLNDNYLIGIVPHSVGLEFLNHECYCPEPDDEDSNEVADALNERIDDLEEKLRSAKERRHELTGRWY